MDTILQEKHNYAWDLFEKGNLTESEKIFRELVAKGAKEAWLGVGLCMRDNPENRSAADFATTSVGALEYSGELNNPIVTATIIGNICAPLGRYVIHLRAEEWAVQFSDDDSVTLSDLARTLNPWIAQLLNQLEFVSPLFLSGEIDLDTTRNYYENILLISELVNNNGQWRNRILGEGANLNLQNQAFTGIKKFGGWQ